MREHGKFWSEGEQPVNLREFPGELAGWLASPDAPPLGVVNIDIFRKPVELPGVAGFVLDESSCLKQASGIIRNNIISSVQGCEYRLACSATPAPNDLEEYVSHALFVGAIKNHKEVFADFFSSDGEGGWNLRSYAQDAFYDFMSSWSIWIRNPATYGFPARLASIPAPVLRDIEVPLTPEQEEVAKPFRSTRSLFLDSVGIVKRGKLAQLSRGFLYEGKKVVPVASHKPGAIADILDCHNAPAVVWVSFNEEGTILAEVLRARGKKVRVVDGKTGEEEREAAVAGLATGETEVLIAKPAQLGFGLNLQAASVCIFSGISDSFEKDYQALRRLWRFGQEKPVHCYYVYTPLERPMLDNLRRKRDAWEVQAAAMEGAYARAAGADLKAFRGESAKSFRLKATISKKDLAVLQKVRPWRA